MEWIFIELAAIFVENFAIIYFLNSRFVSKYSTYLPQISVWAISSVCGILVVFLNLPDLIYSLANFFIMFAFLWFFKHGTFSIKVLHIIIVFALLMSTSIAGAGIASVMTDVNINYTLIYQDTSRLLAIILIKSMQVVLFFAFAKRSTAAHGVSKVSVFAFICIIVALFASLLQIFSIIDNFDMTFNLTLIWVSVGLLFIMIMIFVLYEIFVHEEAKNLTLAANLQRMEIENHYLNEIDFLYADMRKWRHEYTTNLTALYAYIDNNENEKALTYIKNLNVESEQHRNILQTGNIVLDAVVSSKFAFAHSKGINLKIHAVYPKDNEIEDRDLCAIMSNLLDNAIEACLKIEDENRAKFISFSLLAKGKNMMVSISNSFDGVIKKQGNRILTTKDRRFNGIGIGYVDSIIGKYQGIVRREHEGGVFTTNIIIPLKLLSEDDKS
jgi:hypothetical protein